MARDFTEQIERSRKRLAKCLNLLEAEKSTLINTTLNQWVTEAEVVVVDAELSAYVVLPTAE